eukprot:scaffold1616_cov100-Skeletonema_dohrnii-CCMP3373.AAC.12
MFPQWRAVVMPALVLAMLLCVEQLTATVEEFCTQHAEDIERCKQHISTVSSITLATTLSIMDNNTPTSAASGLLLELEQAKIIRSLLRKVGATADAAGVVRQKEGMALANEQLTDVSTELLLTVVLVRLLHERAEGRVAVPSSVASDEQLEDDAAAAADKMKNKRTAAAAKKKEKKKRYKRNKAAAKQKSKNKTTNLMSWMGGGLISLITMVVFGSIATLIFPLSLIHQTDGSGEGDAPPALPPSASRSLRQKGLRSNNDNVASVSPDISRPLAAVVPPPIFSPSAVSNCLMRSDANATFNEIERNALIDFYGSAKGAEWTNATNWLDECASYCDWTGVTCDEKGHVTNLTLAGNGLSGRMSESIGNLTFIEVLDLSDNDMKGSIPEAIGLLSNLTYLRLSYNAFTGAVPESFGELTKLQLLQLQSNRITEVPNMLRLDESEYGYATFVTDCGLSSAFDEVLMYIHILGIVDKKIDKPFTWKCPRNSDVCNYTADFSVASLVMFMLLVTIYLAKDIFEADKLLRQSYKSRHPRRSRIRYFIGGFGLFSVTVYALSASLFYTTKTATSDADLVLKALTVLFVTQLDEKVFSALQAINENWAMQWDKWIFARLGACNQKWTAHAADSEDANSDTDASSDTDAENGSRIEEIKREIETQQAQISDQQNELMRQKIQIEQMARRFGELTELQEGVQNMQESQAGSCASFETIFYCDPNDANENVTSNADAVKSEDAQLDADADPREGGKSTMNGTKMRNHNRKIKLGIRRGRPSKLNASSSGYTRLDSETSLNVRVTQ